MINFKEHNAPSSPLFYYSKIIIKVADKVKLRTVSLEKNIPIINYLQFSIIGLHFHQCLTIIKHRLSLKEIFKSLVSKQHHMEKMLLFSVIRTWNDIQKEMKGVMLNTFSLAKLKSLLIEFYLNMYKTS